MSALATLTDYWPSLVAFFFFGLFHSVGAREPFKALLARWSSPFIVDHFWRLLYFVLSYMWYMHILGPLHWGLHPDDDDWLIDIPDELWQAMVIVHLASIALLYAAFLQSDYLEFVGLKQAWRGIRALLGHPGQQYSPKIFGTQRLEVHGVYAWVRHPMLIGGLLSLLTIGPSLNNLVFTAMYTIYMLIGGYFEELRLIRIFGDDYLAYQNQVGAYLPRLRWRSA